MISSAFVIARKDIKDARRTRLFLIITVLLLLASMLSVAVTAAAMGGFTSPGYSPIEAMRGFVEHLEIIGSALAIIMGYRSAARERGHNTLALVLTRPVSQRAFLAGKVIGGGVLILAALAIVFISIGAELTTLNGTGLSAIEIAKLIIGYVSAVIYMLAFFLLAFVLALHMKQMSQALLVAFSIWLVVVLIAPQIGDTLDPDNQAVGGLFQELAVPRAQELEIMDKFNTYETIRTGIEQLSPSKHFERLTFALWGIKNTYYGMSLAEILWAKMIDIVWLLSYVAALLGLLFRKRTNLAQLSG